MADQVHISRDAPGPAGKPTSEQAHQFGLTAAMALIVGIPVYLGQRRHMAQPASVPPYR